MKKLAMAAVIVLLAAGVSFAKDGRTGDAVPGMHEMHGQTMEIADCLAALKTAFPELQRYLKPADNRTPAVTDRGGSTYYRSQQHDNGDGWGSTD